MAKSDANLMTSNNLAPQEEAPYPQNEGAEESKANWLRQNKLV